MKKIVFIDDGIEFDSSTRINQPTGGAENAFISLVESLAKKNLSISVFNNCRNTGKLNGVNWQKLDKSISKHKFDVIVINRGDKFLNFRKNCTKRIFWIHNPAKYLIKYRYLSKLYFNPATIVFSGNYHLKTYPNWAPNKNKKVIPYGVDDFIFEAKEKLKNFEPIAVFTSNPLRGLDWLLDLWEKDIYPNVPNATLKLFTGMQTYGVHGKKKDSMVFPILNRASSLKSKGVILNHPLPRNKLIKEIKKSRLFLYKGSFDETFCMSVAESQVLGIPSVVKDLGCMSERIIHGKTGFVTKNDKEFSNYAIKLLTENDSWLKMHDYMLKNNSHFSWDKIAEMWKKIL